MQQGLISIILLLLCVFWMAPSVLMARKDKSLARFRAGRVAAYFLAAIAALGIIRLNNSLAERRAEVVVAAVRQYQQKNGRYPQRLEEVTPEFLPAIPRARYSFMWNNFMYFNAGSSPRLVYVAFPPFLRRVYNFESGSWGQID
jgi:O-antigen ligase